jgi:hypothetical protein
MADTITVRVANPPRGTFFERHEDHPGGEAWVRGDKEFKVAKTRRVLSAISGGRIVLVEKSGTEPASADAEKATDAAEASAEGQDTTDTDSAPPEANGDARDVVDTTEPVPNVLTEVRKGPAPSRKSRS